MLKIDKENFRLDKNNYIKNSTVKDKIILLNSFTNGTLHYNRWLNRLNGNYKKTTTYTILKTGEILEHFDPKYYSSIFNDDIDRKLISITLENYGWLEKNKENQFLNAFGFNQENNIFEKPWRGYTYWDNYTELQVESTIDLINNLTENFSIKKEAPVSNVKIPHIYNYEGIIYRSNVAKCYTDLSPAWDYNKFLNHINHDT